MGGGARQKVVSGEGPHFFVGSEAVQGEHVTLDALDSHHLLRVLRARAGEPFVAVAPGPIAYSAVLLEAKGPLAVGRVVTAEPARGEPPVALTLVQGLTKGDKMELIVQKATEIGAAAVVPIRCQRSVVQVDEARVPSRLERWQRIAREAAQQCRRAAVPRVGPLLSWREATRLADEHDLALLLWEEATGGTGLRQALAKASAARRIVVFVGPEGGLTAQEVAEAAAAGAVTVHLGPRILRTETAGLAALAAILYDRGDLGG